jgi:hypothetical protein
MNTRVKLENLQRRDPIRNLDMDKVIFKMDLK